MSIISKYELSESIFLYLLEESLQIAIKSDLSYLDSKTKLDKIEKTLKELVLPENLKVTINKYVEAVKHNVEDYGECAYKTGFKDCILLLKELGLIG